MTIAIVIGLLIGIRGAVAPGSWSDRLATLGAYLGISFPVYWVGMVVILVFAVTKSLVSRRRDMAASSS